MINPEKTYHGRPCKYGHTLRYKKGNSCIKCLHRTTATWRAANKARFKELSARAVQARERLRANPVARAKRNAYEMARYHGGYRESTVENYLVKQTELRHGYAPKWQGVRGAPDRIVLLPGHPVYFVELKKPRGGVFQPGQLRFHARLRQLGQQVFVLRSLEEVDKFFNEIEL